MSQSEATSATGAPASLIPPYPDDLLTAPPSADEQADPELRGLGGGPITADDKLAALGDEFANAVALFRRVDRFAGEKWRVVVRLKRENRWLRGQLESALRRVTELEAALAAAGRPVVLAPTPAAELEAIEAAEAAPTPLARRNGRA
jgi:hypothetical protein